MTSQDFCYWLQGYLEVSNPALIKEKELAIIKEHLNLVFSKVTSGGLGGAGLTNPFVPNPFTNPITYCSSIDNDVSIKAFNTSKTVGFGGQANLPGVPPLKDHGVYTTC